MEKIGVVEEVDGKDRRGENALDRQMAFDHAFTQQIWAECPVP